MAWAMLRLDEAGLLPKRRSTVCTLTPAALATSSSEMSTSIRDVPSSTIASRIPTRVRSAASARAVIVYVRVVFMSATVDTNMRLMSIPIHIK